MHGVRARSRPSNRRTRDFSINAQIGGPPSSPGPAETFENVDVQLVEMGPALIDDVNERQNLHAIEQTQSHGEAVASMASRRRLMFWFEAEIRTFVRVTIRRKMCVAHPRPLLETICSSKSARANLVQRHTHTNDGFAPRRAQYCSLVHEGASTSRL